MSKIADYIERRERERENQTIADFAQELRKFPDALLIQLQEAGVQKNSPTDRLTEADKQKLLQFLRSKQQPKEGKKIILKKSSTACESETDLLLKAMLEEKNGAEWGVLNHFTGLVIAGAKIDSNLQAAVNLIVAQIVICEALPAKKLGRPKNQQTEDMGLEVAKTYWDMRDKGESYSNAVSQLMDDFHKDERHIMRLVKTHEKSVGEDFQAREKKREFEKTLQQLAGAISLTEKIGDPFSFLYEPHLPEFTIEDYMEYLDERVTSTIKARGLTGIKDELFIASD